MHINNNDKSMQLRVMLKLKDGQMRNHTGQGFVKNLFWTLRPKTTPAETIDQAFGFGDLDQADLERIADFMRHPSNDGLVFRGWNEHHGSSTQQFAEPVIEINSKGEVTFPYKEARQAKMASLKENNEVR